MRIVEIASPSRTLTHRHAAVASRAKFTVSSGCSWELLCAGRRNRGLRGPTMARSAACGITAAICEDPGAARPGGVRLRTSERHPVSDLVLPLLDRVRIPADLRQLPESDLAQLAAELRAETIDAVSVTGGHLGAGLGVIELTVALHYVFNTPDDRIIWDVGHQAYPHKILTGRRDRIRTLRQAGGLSGFTKRSESPYDPFGAAHSSTSISAGLGMAIGRDLARRRGTRPRRDAPAPQRRGGDRRRLDLGRHGLRGDEQCRRAEKRLIVILNDNDMSIAPPVGAMSSYLARLVSGDTYRSLRDTAKQFGRPPLAEGPLRHRGPRRGVCPRHPGRRRHDVRGARLPLRRPDRRPQPRAPAARPQERARRPRRPGADPRRHPEGQGLRPRGGRGRSRPRGGEVRRGVGQADQGQAQRPGLHAGVRREPDQGGGRRRQGGGDHRGDALGHRRRPVLKSASRPDLRRRHRRAARGDLRGGPGDGGFKPFCAIYSTFLQRGYDQLVHDVALQNLPVRFALDRAGLVGADGATHAARSISPISAACRT